MLPFVPSHEEDVVVDDGLQTFVEEILEVVEVFDADALEEVNIFHENGRPGPLLDDSEPGIKRITFPQNKIVKMLFLNLFNASF